jgi:hypothetical protein
VTQTLGARLDDVEVVTERNTRNGEALYAGHESNARQIALLMDRVQALSEQQEALGHHVERIFAEHVGMGFLQRLRWVMRGV